MSAEASKKKPFYNQAWFWVIVILVLVVGGAVASGNNDPKKVGETDGTSEQVGSGDTSGSFKVGDVISVDGQEIVISSVERNYQPESEYFAAKDGREYVKVNLQIQNKSQETKSYNTLDWEMEDGSGDINSYIDAAFAQAGDNLGSGSLAAGGTKKGSIVFDVPKGDEKLKIHYKPNLFSSKEAVIEL